MDEGYDLGDFEAVVAHAMQHFCEVLTKAALAHVEQAVAAIDGIRDDSLRRVPSSPSPSGSGPTWLPWARACRARPRAPGRR
jgi:hypothetical protein